MSEGRTATETGTLPTDPTQAVAFWLAELEAAKKREQDYREDGEAILKLYEAEKEARPYFNILYSNTEVLMPSLYSNVPRPVVSRRFKDDDPLGKAAAQAGTRCLEFLLDTNVEGYETFDQAMEHVVLDACLPGRGATVVQYDALITSTAGTEGDSATVDAAPTERVERELVCCNAQQWNRVWYGYAKKWKDVPWVAYEQYVDHGEAARLFGEQVANALAYSTSKTEAAGDRKADTREEQHQGERKLCRIYQIWDRENGRKIRYVSEAYRDGYLRDEIDDPLQLTGFYNCPRPLSFVLKTHSLIPTPLYNEYREQAKELNDLTKRIQKIVTAIKARGLYDGELGGDLAKLFEADDNELIPAEKGASIAAEKGLGNAIWFMPIEQLVITLRELYQAREACKSVIYEITGISDILRGATQASETATAQQIKQQWGSLRLKRLQRRVANYARDVLRLMLELAATKFSQETWAKMTGLPFLLDEQFTQLQAVQQTLKQQALMEQMQAQSMPQMGQQAPPSRVTQQLQQVEQQLQAPKWSDVLSLLQNDLHRAYRIDIETNSTVEPEAAEDQKNMTELLTALSQYLNGVGPLVAKGVMPFQAAQSIMLTIVRRYRFGTEIEESLKAMQPPQPEQDTAAQQQALKQQQQLMQQQLKLEQEKMQLQQEMQAVQAEQRLMEQRMQLQLDALKLKFEEAALKLKEQTASAKIAAQTQALQAKQRMAQQSARRRQA